MNALLADTLFRLIGNFVGDQAPKQNTDYGKEAGDVDPSYKGDPSQLVQQPYVTPSFGTKFFHPEVAAQENQGNTAQFQSLVDNAIKNKVGGVNTTLASQTAGLPYQEAVASNPESAFRTYPNQSQEGIASGNKSAFDIKSNAPYYASKVGLGADIDTIQKYAERLRTGSAAKEVNAGNAVSNYQIQTLPSKTNLDVTRNATDLFLEPSRGYAGLFNNLSEGDLGKRVHTGSDKLDSVLNTKLNTEMSEGSVQEALSKEKANNIPLLSQMQKQERANTLWNVMHPEYPNALLMRDTDTGQPRFNKDYVNAVDIMQRKFKGTGGSGSSPSGIPFSGGLINLGKESNPKSSDLTPTIGNSSLSPKSHTVNNSSGKEIELPNDPAYVRAKRGMLLSVAQDKFRKGIPLDKYDINYFTPDELKQIYGTK